MAERTAGFTTYLTVLAAAETRERNDNDYTDYESAHPPPKDLCVVLDMVIGRRWDEVLELLPSQSLRDLTHMVAFFLRSYGPVFPEHVWRTMFAAIPSSMDTARADTDRHGGNDRVATTATTAAAETAATLSLSAPPLSVFANEPQKSLLHRALEADLEPSLQHWMIREVLRVYPTSVSVLDEEYESPLDVLCRKIMAIEEHNTDSVADRYRTSGYALSGDARRFTERYWECARLMLNSPSCQDDPILHALARNSNSRCPLALRSRILRCFKHQAQQRNAYGDLPLHVAARMMSNSTNDDDDDDDDDTDDDDNESQDDNIVIDILRLCPDAAREVNGDGKLPLELAAEQPQASWRNGMNSFVRAFPGGLWRLRVWTNRGLIAFFLQGKTLAETHAILTSNPGVLLG